MEWEPQYIMNADTFLAATKGKLIVSCQALEDEPLHGAEVMAKMALAAKIGGAAAIRANGPADISAIKQRVDLPVIGLYKQGRQRCNHHADNCSGCGDRGSGRRYHRARLHRSTTTGWLATLRIDRAHPPRIEAPDLRGCIDAGARRMAAAEHAGVAMTAPTLSGYTEDSPAQDGPDFDIVGAA